MYDEWYGEVTESQYNAYKKFNVSTLDHMMLEIKFGEGNSKDITKFVIDRKGRFTFEDWVQ